MEGDRAVAEQGDGLLLGRGPIVDANNHVVDGSTPFHSASNPQGLKISQPCAFAMLRGKQRYANDFGSLSIQSGAVTQPVCAAATRGGCNI